MRHTKKATQKITYKKAFGIAVPLCLFALFLACLMISVLNDTYAFVKPEGRVLLSVTQAIDAEELANRLHMLGVVQNPHVFRMFLKLRGLDGKVPFLLGEWTLNSNMSYREIILNLF